MIDGKKLESKAFSIVDRIVSTHLNYIVVATTENGKAQLAEYLVCRRHFEKGEECPHFTDKTLSLRMTVGYVVLNKRFKFWSDLLRRFGLNLTPRYIFTHRDGGKPIKFKSQRLYDLLNPHEINKFLVAFYDK